jgi:hypothetical protein
MPARCPQIELAGRTFALDINVVSASQSAVVKYALVADDTTITRPACAMLTPGSMTWQPASPNTLTGCP